MSAAKCRRELRRRLFCGIIVPVMNIVMIGPFAFKPKGTVSARAFFIARALVSRGHRVTILMPPYDNLTDSGRTWQQDGVRLENMHIRRNDAWHQFSVPLRLARRAVQLSADVVHVFKPIGYSGLAGLWLRRFSRRPLVLDTDDWEGPGGWNDVNPYPALWKRLFAWQERWLARSADAVTVVSRTLQTQVWGFGVDPARVVYLPNGPDPGLRAWPGVDAEQRAAVRARLGVGDAPLALYLGHIPHGSDLDLAVDAFARLGDRLPEARLVIAGVGDGLPRLQAHAQAIGVAERVLFPGWIEHEQAAAYVASADVAVNPYRDTLINRAKCAGKVVTAMALGKAVVTSRLGQNVEYIEDGRSGLLTEPGDAGDLARALAAVLSDRAWAEELGQNARQRIWARFDWDARVGEVEGAYRMARGQGKPGA
jgi:glycosyltransferase involved in cell wall biosynthesis